MKGTGETTPIRLLLVDDHALLRRALAKALVLHDDFDVVGEAGDGREALRLAAKLKPDVVLLDVVMPGLGGIETARRLREEYHSMRVLAGNVEIRGPG